MLEFKDITIDELNRIEMYLKGSGNFSCEFSKGNIFMWNIENEIKYAIVEGTPIFRNVEEETVVYSMPFYDEKSLVMEELIEDAKMLKKTFILHLVSKAMKEQLEAKYGDTFVYTTKEDYSDYIYNVDELIRLSGRKYHGKKNHINYFLKNYSYSYEKINTSNIEECRILKNQWVEAEERTASADRESIAIDRAFDHYEELGLVGGLIRVNGAVKAFTFGEALNDEVFVTHVEKADATIRGLYPMINHEFAVNELSSYQYVNREEDMGIEGLRKAKQSYGPVLMWEKYEVKLND
ncbi:MAG: DUF2156 domain-containing protein [Lachnospiraceae bacterium]|nr:DUF2156 domain-containing protein [Lachnospiraceae bacterium]